MHYFTSQEPLEQAESQTFTIRGKIHRVSLGPGVFSAHGVDKATEILLSTFATPEGESSDRVHTVADIGCGWGPIAIALADEFPHAQIWATDVNKRALALCAHNLGSDVDAVITFDGDAYQKACDENIYFDYILSNPPVRIGKKPMWELLERWLSRLAQDGEMWIVIGKNLGADSLAKHLDRIGWNVERVSSKKGFRVLCISRGKMTDKLNG